jgi:hypothetical protein
VFPVRYEVGFYISEDGVLHCHHRDNLKSDIDLGELSILWRHIVFPVRYEVGFYISEDGINHS